MQSTTSPKLAFALAGGVALLNLAPYTVPAADTMAGVRYDESALEADIPHHHVGIFAGGATRYRAPDREEEETGFAAGVEYEYRFARPWGVGLLWEGVTTDHARDAILVVPLNWHPWEWLKLSVAPGVELVEHGDHEIVLRVAAAYEIELGKWNLAPEISWDLTPESQTVVYGLSVGRRF